MTNFSYCEAYAISFINEIKKDTNPNNIIQLLLGFYVCEFLDKSKGWQDSSVAQLSIETYFRNSQNIWNKKNVFLSALENLKKLNLFEVKYKKMCDFFYLNIIANRKAEKQLNSLYFKALNKFILHSIMNYIKKDNKKILKIIIKIFNKKLFAFFKAYSIKKTKYELRFFWRSTLYPKIYDGGGELFNQEYYKHHFNTDEYLVINKDANIKIREHELQIKNCLHDTYNISHFTKKHSLTFPLNAEELKKLLDKENLSLLNLLKLPEGPLNHLPQGPHTYVRVHKNRYTRKLKKHLKIEFSLIKIQDTQWKTMCIESSKIQNVLALSFLIDQANAEILTYEEFLYKHGDVGLERDRTK